MASEQSYNFLREVVMTQTANKVPPERNSLLETRLQPLVRQAGAADLDGFVQQLRERTLPVSAHRAVGEAMLIQETSFFRDRRPFDLLRRAVLPSLIERQRPVRQLRLWSAASSTGQEAYSLAMLLCEHFPELCGWDVRILGTDISPVARDYAARGCYNRVEMNRGLPARLLVKYFDRVGDVWQVRPQLRSMVEFRVMNLCGPVAVLPVFDVVLLRNVLLYFEREQRSHVLTQMHARMHDDSALVLGNSEQAEESSDLFRARLEDDSYFYRRAA